MESERSDMSSCRLLEAQQSRQEARCECTGNHGGSKQGGVNIDMFYINRFGCYMEITEGCEKEQGDPSGDLTAIQGRKGDDSIWVGGSRGRRVVGFWLCFKVEPTIPARLPHFSGHGRWSYKGKDYQKHGDIIRVINLYVKI